MVNNRYTAPLTCVVIDDEPLAVRLIENYIQRTEGLQLQASFTDPVKAMAELSRKAPNLIFLDIQMPDINGMELARMVDADTRIVFTTAFKDYAFDSYEVNALDYLLKPIRYSNFLAAVEKAKEWFQMKSANDGNTAPPSVDRDFTFVRVDGELKRIDFSDIIMVKGMKDYMLFYLATSSRPLIVHITMKAVEEMLPPTTFMRVNRSYIVALNQVKTIDRNNCIYIAGEAIRITDTYREAFDRFLQN